MFTPSSDPRQPFTVPSPSAASVSMRTEVVATTVEEKVQLEQPALQQKMSPGHDPFLLPDRTELVDERLRCQDVDYLLRSESSRASQTSSVVIARRRSSCWCVRSCPGVPRARSVKTRYSPTAVHMVAWSMWAAHLALVSVACPVDADLTAP